MGKISSSSTHELLFPHVVISPLFFSTPLSPLSPKKILLGDKLISATFNSTLFWETEMSRKKNSLQLQATFCVCVIDVEKEGRGGEEVTKIRSNPAFSRRKKNYLLHCEPEKISGKTLESMMRLFSPSLPSGGWRRRRRRRRRRGERRIMKLEKWNT